MQGLWLVIMPKSGCDCYCRPLNPQDTNIQSAVWSISIRGLL